MGTDLTLHDVPVEDLIKLQKGAEKIKLWTLTNGGCYYSMKITIRDLDLILFTDDLPEVHPKLKHKEVLDANR